MHKLLFKEIINIVKPHYSFMKFELTNMCYYEYNLNIA